MNAIRPAGAMVRQELEAWRRRACRIKRLSENEIRGYTVMKLTRKQALIAARRRQR